MHSGEKAEEAAREKREGAKQPSRVDYLSIDRNVAANQLTVSSIASGNLALYEVHVCVRVFLILCGQTSVTLFTYNVL